MSRIELSVASVTMHRNKSRNQSAQTILGMQPVGGLFFYAHRCAQENSPAETHELSTLITMFKYLQRIFQQ
jgi:hypothetical protein